MNIVVKTIPHAEQRYDTCGDWFFENGDLHIRVSKLGNEYYEYLIAAHELDEAMLCKLRGISEKEVTDFDIAFLKNLRNGTNEPGDAINAPYFKEHTFATLMEKFRALEMGIDWDTYEQSVINL